MSADPLLQARLKIADVIEEVAGAATLLREAHDCASSGNIEGAVQCVEDVGDAVDAAIEHLKALRNVSSIWAIAAQELESEEEL